MATTVRLPPRIGDVQPRHAVQRCRAEVHPAGSVQACQRPRVALRVTRGRHHVDVTPRDGCQALAGVDHGTYDVDVGPGGQRDVFTGNAACKVVDVVRQLIRRLRN